MSNVKVHTGKTVEFEIPCTLEGRLTRTNNKDKVKIIFESPRGVAPREYLDIRLSISDLLKLNKAFKVIKKLLNKNIKNLKYSDNIDDHEVVVEVAGEIKYGINVEIGGVKCLLTLESSTFWYELNFTVPSKPKKAISGFVTDLSDFLKTLSFAEKDDLNVVIKAFDAIVK